MIPVGSFDPDRVALAAASAHRDARMDDVEHARREAEVVLERLLARWQSERLSAPESTYVWNGSARAAIDALSAVETAVDALHRGPRLIRPRSHS